MIKVHVISDLLFYYNEFADPIDETIPECDLVIIVGNLGYIRRSMLYTETLCKKYPNTQFIYNMGRTEGTNQKNDTEIIDGLKTRQLLSPFWPKNLHYADKEPVKLTINDQEIEVLSLHGYPNVSESVQDDKVWKSHSWTRYVNHGVTNNQHDFKLPEAADVDHGHFWLWSTPERCREDHSKEDMLIKAWLDSKSDAIKILVTALSPIQDPCLPGVEYTMHSDITPDYWIFGGSKLNTINNNGVVLYGNPGRGSDARGEVLEVNSK